MLPFMLFMFIGVLFPMVMVVSDTCASATTLATVAVRTSYATLCPGVVDAADPTLCTVTVTLPMVSSVVGGVPQPPLHITANVTGAVEEVITGDCSTGYLDAAFAQVANVAGQLVMQQYNASVAHLEEPVDGFEARPEVLYYLEQAAGVIALRARGLVLETGSTVLTCEALHEQFMDTKDAVCCKVLYVGLSQKVAALELVFPACMTRFFACLFACLFVCFCVLGCVDVRDVVFVCVCGQKPPVLAGDVVDRHHPVHVLLRLLGHAHGLQALPLQARAVRGRGVCAGVPPPARPRQPPSRGRNGGGSDPVTPVLRPLLARPV